MMLRVLLIAALVPLSIAQLTSSCTSCQSSSSNSNYEPGMLPSYQGDAFTADARRLETLRLNEAHFEQHPTTTTTTTTTTSHPTLAPAPHLTFKNRPIPVVLPDSKEEDAVFVELIGDDTNETTRHQPTLEFVKFSAPNPPNSPNSQFGDLHYETDATRAIIEALSRDDPKFIQKDFQVHFVDEE